MKVLTQDTLHGLLLVELWVNERWQADHHLVEEAAERPQVTLLGKLLSSEKFGGQVLKSAKEFRTGRGLKALGRPRGKSIITG